jgi:hypothetical protein
MEEESEQARLERKGGNKETSVGRRKETPNEIEYKCRRDKVSDTVACQWCHR